MTLRHSVLVILLLIVGPVAACSGGTGPAGAPLTHPAAGEVDAMLMLDGRPHGVAVAENGTFYISQIDGNAVTRGEVNEISQQFNGSAVVGLTPAHVAVDPAGTTAYTADQYGNTASVVDVADNTLRATVPLSDGGFNVLVSPSGKRLYVTTAAGVLHIINTTDLEVVKTIDVGDAANGLAYHGSRNLLYVSSIFENKVTAINAATEQVVRTYPVSPGPQRIAVSADGGRVYIASQSVGLEVLTVATGQRIVVADVPHGAVGLALTPDGEQVYVTNPPAGTVYIVDTDDLAVVKVLSGLARPRNVAFAARGTTAIVTGEGNVVYFIR